jgi:hypothetical protein
MELKGNNVTGRTKLLDGGHFDDWEFETKAEIRNKGRE